MARPVVRVMIMFFFPKTNASGITDYGAVPVSTFGIYIVLLYLCERTRAPSWVRYDNNIRDDSSE